jgi:hypothetical protein
MAPVPILIMEKEIIQNCVARFPYMKELITDKQDDTGVPKKKDESIASLFIGGF